MIGDATVRQVRKEKIVDQLTVHHVFIATHARTMPYAGLLIITAFTVFALVIGLVNFVRLEYPYVVSRILVLTVVLVLITYASVLETSLAISAKHTVI